MPRHLALALALAACSRTSPSPPPSSSPPPAFSALAGAWSTSLPDADARLTVLPSGAVLATATIRGVPVHETGSIESWDGSTLLVRVPSRQLRLALPARLAADTLTVDVPELGDVTFRRLR